jgi:hypothetical protein
MDGEKAIDQVVGSTRMPFRVLINTWECSCGLPLQVDRENRHMTYDVLVRKAEQKW